MAAVLWEAKGMGGRCNYNFKNKNYILKINRKLQYKEIEKIKRIKGERKGRKKKEKEERQGKKHYLVNLTKVGLDRHQNQSTATSSAQSEFCIALPWQGGSVICCNNAKQFHLSTA